MADGTFTRAVRIVDTAECEVRGTEPFLAQAQLIDADLDRHAKIDRGETLQRRQTMKCHLRILLAVDRNDVFAAPAQKLVDAEVLDVSSVGNVDITPGFSGP